MTHHPNIPCDFCEVFGHLDGDGAGQIIPCIGFNNQTSENHGAIDTSNGINGLRGSLGSCELRFKRSHCIKQLEPHF